MLPNTLSTSYGYKRRKAGAPRITYGRSWKPLPLTGDHFLRSEISCIPPEEEHISSWPSLLDRHGTAHKGSGIRDDSEEEAQQSSHNSFPAVTEDMSTPKLKRRSPSLTTIHFQPLNSQPADPSVSKSRSARNKPRTRDTQSANVTNVAAVERLEMQGQTKKTLPKRHQDSKKRLTARKQRRLPVNELLLVASLPNDTTVVDDQQSNLCQQQSLDPIAPTSSPSQRGILRPTSLTDSEDERRFASAPLSAIRKRIRAPGHKFLTELRRKQRARTFDGNDIERAGDGFADDERKITAPSKIGRKGPRRNLLVHNFNALQLATGPLPDTAFDVPNAAAKLDVAQYPAPSPTGGATGFSHDFGGSDQNNFFNATAHPSSPKRPTPCLSFGDEIRRDLIQQQLSSISAPRRVHSPSSDADDDCDDDDDGYDSSLLEDDLSNNQSECQSVHSLGSAGGDDAMQQGQTEYENSGHGLPGNPSPLSAVQPIHSSAGIDAGTAGVVLPFERCDTRLSVNFRSQALTPARRMYSQRRRSRQPKEPREAVEDEPAFESAYALNSSHGADQVLGSANSLNVAPLRRQPGTTAMEERCRRPRSILRSPSMQAISKTTSRVEATQANTRRNSLRQTTAIFLGDQSRYFSNFSSKIPSSPPHAVETTIAPRKRSGCLPYRYPKVGNEDDVEVERSEKVVPETAPDRGFQYVDEDCGEGRVLRRSGNVTWRTDQSLPAASATTSDLRVLTRTVSREHGTLSQASRRRPSLPFQSPARVR